MDSLDHSDALLEESILQLRDAWDENKRMFFRALEDSEKSTVTVRFEATLDCSEPAPLVTSVLKWKDKAEERGVKVVKSYTSSTRKKELPDPSAPSLPGIEEEEVAPKRKKKAPKEA